MATLCRDAMWEVYAAAADFVANEEGHQPRLGDRWYRLADAVATVQAGAEDPIPQKEETSDDSGYDLSDPKHPTYYDRMVGRWDNRDKTEGGLGGRDERQDTREKSGSVLIDRQEANVPSAEPDSLHPPERERGAASTLPAYFPCGRARHGVFCRKPRGHSGRCDL